MITDLNYEGIKFPVSKKYCKTEKKKSALMYFVMKMI